MEKAELIERLKGYEWNDVEFKRALRGVPDSAYETVSAFSNTGGGWLVFGIRDGAGGYEFVGVLEVDKVQNDFLSILRSGQKLNRVIAVDERLIEDDGKALLVFHIPEARRQDKPIYLGGDIRRSFIRNWRRLGRVPPIIVNDRTRKAFQLTLLKEELLSEEQLLFQAELGVHLDDAEATTFAFACRHGRLRPRDVRAVTGLSGAGVQAVLDRLAIQALISPLEGAETPVFVLAEHLVERLGRTDRADDLVGAGTPGLVTDQVGTKPGRLVTDQARSGQEDLSTAQASGPSSSLSTAQAGSDSASLFTAQADRTPGSLFTAQAGPLTELSANQRKIIEICDIPRSLTVIMNALGVAGRGYFKRRHLDPLLRGGVLRMTHPDQPKHPNQAYVLTDAGAKLKSGDVNEDAAKVDRDRINGA